MLVVVLNKPDWDMDEMGLNSGVLGHSDMENPILKEGLDCWLHRVRGQLKPGVIRAV